MWQVSLFTFAKPLISCGVSDNEINEVKCSLSSIILMISEKYNITTVKKTTADISSRTSRAANPVMSLYFRSSLIQHHSSFKHYKHSWIAKERGRSAALCWMHKILQSTSINMTGRGAVATAASWIPLCRYWMEIQPVHSGYLVFFVSIQASPRIAKTVKMQQFGK